MVVVERPTFAGQATAGVDEEGLVALVDRPSQSWGEREVQIWREAG